VWHNLWLEWLDWPVGLAEGLAHGCTRLGTVHQSKRQGC